MAVFVAASDESTGKNHLSPFHYIGWIASEPDWYNFFAPAWQSRVLDGPPPIPYLHVTEMRSRSWREKHGLTELKADDRMYEAASVIEAMGSLMPFKVTIDCSVFRPLFREHKLRLDTGGTRNLEPDFLAFTAYAYAVLLDLRSNFSDVERVDFLVENKSDVTKHIHGFYKSLPASLIQMGKPELASLLGEFIPAGKDRVPLQAADFLAWHIQRAEHKTLESADRKRLWMIGNRPMFDYNVSTQTLTELARAYDKVGKENEKNERIRRLQQNNARSDGRNTRRIKSRIGPRKG